uniref:Uncharacterized protein n=1 Tax=Glossina morsitans morsitans TaxID=37546 RepID=A0A1B0FHC6_GLOMM
MKTMFHEKLFASIRGTTTTTKNQERSYQKDDSQDERNVLNDVEYDIEYGNDDDNVNGDDHDDDHDDDDVDDDDDDAFSINVAFFSIVQPEFNVSSLYNHQIVPIALASSIIADFL